MSSMLRKTLSKASLRGVSRSETKAVEILKFKDIELCLSSNL